MYVTDTSNIEIEDVRAARKKEYKKNIAAKKVPKGICPKTLGKVTKTNPGPSPGDTPNANTAGKIANPAKRATIVSATTTEYVALGRLSSLLK